MSLRVVAGIQCAGIERVDSARSGVRFGGSRSSRRLVFTQWFAANLRHPYTTPPVVSAYVPSFPGEAIERKLRARQVVDGGTLWLVVPTDEGVFLETQRVGEFTLACDTQIYLDLLHVGLRGPDQAKALREWPGFGRAAA